MKKTAVVFPGQGAQYVGMGEGLSKYPIYNDVMSRANEILGFDLRELCKNGPIEELTRTDNSQVAIYTLGYIGYLIVKEIMPADWQPDYVAGLSLGEFTALASAGVFSFEDGLMLVRKRGTFMMEACAQTLGAMASIVGAEKDQVKAIVEKQVAVGKILAMANLNCPGQIVISGSKDAVAQASSDAENSGFKVVQLNVSGAFHSPLMESAKKKLEKEVANIVFNNPKIPVITNCDAKVKTDSQEIKESVIRQIVSSVHWNETVDFMISNGVEMFIEPGCGKVLKGLIRRIDRQTVCVSVESEPDFIEIEKMISQQIIQ